MISDLVKENIYLFQSEPRLHVIYLLSAYRKASSRGAYGQLDMILFEVFLKNIHFIPQDKIVQWHYL